MILPADPDTYALSFQNLVEIHVLSVIRRHRDVPLPKVRHAIEVLRSELKTEHPLADVQMATVGRQIYAEVAGKYRLVSEADIQGAFDQLITLYLERIERDPKNVPIKLFPWILTRPAKPEDLRLDPGRKVVISPEVSFGRPCVTGTGIRTSIIFSRWKAGEKMHEIAEDYAQPVENVEEAIRYEENSDVRQPAA